MFFFARQLGGDNLRSQPDIQCALDLSNVAARRELFARIASENKRVLVMTEGLLVYLEREQVLSLGQDLAYAKKFQRWICDLQSPGLLKMLQKKPEDRYQNAGDLLAELEGLPLG